MGQTFSFKLNEKDVIRVQSVNLKNLNLAIASLLKKDQDYYTNVEFDSKEIAEDTLRFLENTLDEECKKINIPLKLEESKQNSEVLVWFEEVGHVIIRSGHGGHIIAVLGNMAGYEIIFLEHSIKTPKISGRLLHSLSNFIGEKSRFPSNDKPFLQVILSKARSFVQANSGYDWTDASIIMNGVCPLTLKSGNGLHQFAINETQEMSKQVATESIEAITKGLVDEKKHLSELKSKILKTKKKLDKQLLSSQDQSIQAVKRKQSSTDESLPKQDLLNIKREKIKEESNQQQQIDTKTNSVDLLVETSTKISDDMKEESTDKANDVEIRKKAEILMLHLQKIEDNEHVISRKQDKIKDMIGEENKLEDQLKNEQSKLLDIERNLREITERISKTKQNHRSQIAKLSKEMTDRKNDIVCMESEQKQMERIDKDKSTKPIVETIDLKNVDARQLGKLRVSFCGNEGAKKTNIQTSLEKQFMEITDYYKQHEKEKYWKDCSIEFFNEEDYICVKIGNGNKKILITSINGFVKVSVK